MPPAPAAAAEDARPASMPLAAAPAATTTSGSSGSSPAVVDNPTPHRLPEGENAAPLEVIGTTASDKLVIIMVGLPATGTLCILYLEC